MTDRPGHRLGQGPLTISRVLRDAAGMFVLGRWRVVAVALLLFGFPSLLAAIARSTIESMPASPGAATIALVVVAVGVAGALRLFGPVLFSGFLDEAVGQEYLFGHHSSFAEVVRLLPWLRLVVADVIVTVGTAVGLALLVVPGVIFFTLFGLVGPVIVQEHHGLTDAFRRTFRLSRSALAIVVALVLIPTAFEASLHEVLHEVAHESGLGIQALIDWMVAAVVGGTIGLLEVALAAELMARFPQSKSTGRLGTPVDAEMSTDE